MRSQCIEGTDYQKFVKAEIELEDESQQIIAEQILMGYNNGYFDIYNSILDKYVSVGWSLNFEHDLYD